MNKPTYYKDWDELPIVLTLSDCAVVLNKTYHTVQKWAKAGKLPAKQIGDGEWIITKKNLRQYVGETE